MGNGQGLTTPDDLDNDLSAQPTPFSQAALGKRPPGVSQLQGDLIEASAYEIHAKVGLLAPAGLSWTPGTESSDEILRLARSFHRLLLGFDGTPTSAQAIQINQVVFDLLNAATRLSDADRLVVDAVAADVGALAKEKGVPLGAPHPASKVIETAQDDDARITATADAVEATVSDITTRLSASDSDRAQNAGLVAGATPRLVTLLDLLTVRPTPREDAARRMESFKRLTSAIGILASQCRERNVDMVASKLDQVFEAENTMLQRCRQKAATERHDYWHDVSASNMDDPYHFDPSRKTGGALVDQIMAGYQEGGAQQMNALNGLGTKLTEPPPPEEVSLFERLLAGVVAYGLDTLSGHLASGFASSLSVLAKNPGAISAAARDAAEGAADIAGAAKGHLPHPVQHGVEAVGRGGQRAGRTIAAAAGPAARAVADVVMPPPEFFADFAAFGRRTLGVVDAKGIAIGLAKDFKKEAVGAVGKPEGAHAQGPLSSTFLDEMGRQVSKHLHKINQHAPEFRAYLEKIPPDALERIAVAQEAALTGAYDAMTHAIAERWTVVLAAATAGEDKDGTTAHAGTLHDSFKLPGVVQLRVLVGTGRGPLGMMMPDIREASRPILNGVGATLKDDLTKTHRPLHSVQMQRTLRIDYISPDGFIDTAGTVDIGPDGQVDLSRADIGVLGALLHGQVPSHGTLGAVAHADPAEAQEAARMLLRALAFTTADL